MLRKRVPKPEGKVSRKNDNHMSVFTALCGRHGVAKAIYVS